LSRPFSPAADKARVKKQPPTTSKKQTDAQKKLAIEKKVDGNRQAWARIIVSAVQAYGKIIELAELEEVKQHLEALEKSVGKVSTALKAELAKLETKAKAANIQIKKDSSTETMLLMYEYLSKALQLHAASNNELQKREQEQTQQILKWYSKWQKLAPEQHRAEEAQMDAKSEKDAKKFMAWHNSADRLKFDEAYANRWATKAKVMIPHLLA
jgi:hypothetical protein